MKRRYNDQLFARCHKTDRLIAQLAARALDQALSEFIRDAVRKEAIRVIQEPSEPPREAIA